jgi:hypothetical protein
MQLPLPLFSWATLGYGALRVPHNSASKASLQLSIKQRRCRGRIWQDAELPRGEGFGGWYDCVLLLRVSPGLAEILVLLVRHLPAVRTYLLCT